MTEIDFTDPYWGSYSDVGPGWHGIVLELDKKLREEAPGFRWSQIKEKFGGLRAYLFFGEDTPDEVRERAHQLTDAAEEQAWKTCEKCGEPGRMRKEHAWGRTLCDTCDSESKP
ncbi:MAG: hypothetical protein ACRC20_12345 [Segniliparus sp.]|uniref:hypothetical protein n=1 Tax=Segniliparus sp. TaxID=2804064 RepID=UPI003F3F1901